MKKIILLQWLLCSASFFLPGYLHSQAPEIYSSSRILADLKKLKVLGNVLYLAAHPDDENTRLIAYLKNELLLNTSYLSLTRGDGGQNLIGSEQGNLLGLIRTQELLQARRVDGGKQYFSRARDFGFSKNPEETFHTWNREQVLSDVVWVIRNLKPDVIITRFSLEPGKTHGHHTASAMLGVEAFEAAADPGKFPEQLKYVSVWQAKRIVWNSSRFQYSSDSAMLAKKPLLLQVGGYNALLGKSYGELAAESRSMHKSQGFGSGANRGEMPEYFEHLNGTKAESNLFDGVDLSWNRVKGGEAISTAVDQIISSYNPSQPSSSVPSLLNLYKSINALDESYWKQVKLTEVSNLIKNSLGLFFEATATTYQVCPGEKIKINLEAVNRSDKKVIIDQVKFNPLLKDTTFNMPLSIKLSNYSTTLTVPQATAISQPYWLKAPGTLGMFEVKDQLQIGLSENLPAFTVEFKTLIEGQPFSYTIPVVYKKTDPVDGEIYRPVVVIPPVFINIDQNVILFDDDKPKNFPVTIKAGKNNVKGTLAFDLPIGWKVINNKISFSLKTKDEEQQIMLTVQPPTVAEEGTLLVKAVIDGKEYHDGLTLIQYKHIPAQTLFPIAAVKVIRLDLKKKGTHIAYIMGAGDEIPSSLEQVGYQVKVLNENEVTLANLKKYDAVITGVRALNTLEKFKLYQKQLFQYVKEGGSLVVQYNTNGALMVDSLAPFPMKISSDRVTVEDAPVTFLKPDHPVLNVPNKITSKDFENWVQERGLYFPNQWSKEFEAILACNDPGETPKEGGLLIARYGQGFYIYTGYSWFRELPAGVPGAFRLFVNMISLGKK